MPPSETQSYAVFMVEDIHTADVTYELGLRAEHQKIDAEGFARKQHTPVSASLSALWNATENIRVLYALIRHVLLYPVYQIVFRQSHHLLILHADNRYTQSETL
jgi:hypothetical protein